MQTATSLADQIKIMLIDDDDAVRDAISEILSRKGWRVDSFNRAESGIAALKGANYDVVLTDINMPGVNGIDFMRLAKEVAPNTPVVVITGYPSIGLAVDAMKIGAVDFLAKPFKTEELEICIRKAVNEAKVAKTGGNEKGATNVRAIGSLPQVARHRLEDKIRELSILHTISETLDDANAKEDIFRKTMDIAQIITDTDKAFILIMEQNNKDLVVRTSSGYDNPLTGLSFLAKDEPFQSVIKNKCYSYILVESNELAPLVGRRGLNERESLVLAPMMINREVVAMLGLAGMKPGTELTTDSASLLLNLTAKASLKIENLALSDNIFSSIIGALNSLINALDARDTYTKDHSNRVTQYAVNIARALKCQQDVLDSISFAGPLHDIGKIGVRDDILLKKGHFTPDEKEVMNSHVTRGEEILRPLNLLSSEKAVVLYHHERWDGGGYPSGLAGHNIPIVARIFSVADTFDAMTSTRPYRQALPIGTAREEILRCSGSQFDPEVVKAFIESDILKTDH